MAYDVVFKLRFNNKLITLLQYLEKHWGEKTAVELLETIDQRIEALKFYPLIGKPSRIKPEIKSVLITKHNRLYYRVQKKKIIILNMYDTRRNPQRNPYESE